MKHWFWNWRNCVIELEYKKEGSASFSPAGTVHIFLTRLNFSRTEQSNVFCPLEPNVLDLVEYKTCEHGCAVLLKVRGAGILLHIFYMSCSTLNSAKLLLLPGHMIDKRRLIQRQVAVWQQREIKLRTDIGGWTFRQVIFFLSFSTSIRRTSSGYGLHTPQHLHILFGDFERFDHSAESSQFPFRLYHLLGHP